MPEVKTQISRADRRDARLKLIRDNAAVPMVKVYAGNETMRRLLKHPSAGAFRSMGDAVEWPNDSFTTRRIRDGSVRTDGPASGDTPPDDDKLNARERAAARVPKPKEERPRTPQQRRTEQQTPAS